MFHLNDFKNLNLKSSAKVMRHTLVIVIKNTPWKLFTNTQPLNSWAKQRWRLPTSLLCTVPAMVWHPGPQPDVPFSWWEKSKVCDHALGTFCIQIVKKKKMPSAKATRAPLSESQNVQGPSWEMLQVLWEWTSGGWCCYFVASTVALRCNYPCLKDPSWGPGWTHMLQTWLLYSMCFFFSPSAMQSLC